MGFFNAMSSIGKMNKLLIDTEWQLKRITDLMENNAPNIQIQQEVRNLVDLYNQMGSVLENSAGARIATYSFLGKKCRSLDVLLFLKEIIRDINNQ